MTAAEKKLLNVQRAYRDFTRAAEALMRLVNQSAGGETSSLAQIDVIQQTVCDHYQLPLSVMSSRIRTQAYVTARHVAMWLCRETTRHTLTEIGRCFGGRDHNTVEWASKKTLGFMQTDPTFSAELQNLRGAVVGRLQKIDIPLLHAAMDGVGK